MFWLMRGCMDIWSKLVHQPTNPSINTHKIVKVCVDVCGYGCDYVNVNVAVSVSANDNAIGCVDVYEKFFLRLLTKPNSCVIMASQNKNARPLGKLIFVFELMRTIPIFKFDF